MYYVCACVTITLNQSISLLPIPAAARYCATGHPRPPAPTISTEDDLILL